MDFFELHEPGLRFKRLFSIDYRSLAAFRIMSAITLIFALLVILPDLEAFYTDLGFLPRSELVEIAPYARMSLFALNGSYGFALLVWVMGFAGALALLAGYRSRQAAIVCWVVFLALAIRNPLITQGGDRLMPLLLFWAMFLPIGKKFAVDAALDRQEGQGEGTHFSIATVGLLVQILYVYVIGALLKNSEVWFPAGAAVYFAMHLDTFATSLAIWFRQFAVGTILLTYFVIAIELFAPLLLFFPDKHQRVRTVTIGLLMAMHVGFRAFINIGHFWLASMSSLFAYIPSAVWDVLCQWYWKNGQARIEIYYDRDCGFCLKTALILREFFLPRSVLVAPAQSIPEIGEVLEREASWVVVDTHGRHRLHWDAVTYICRQSMLLAPVGWLATLYGKIGLGLPTYRLIGTNRKGLSTLTGHLLVQRPAGVSLSWPVNIFLAAVIVACLSWNIAGLYDKERGLTVYPAGMADAMRLLGLAQRWSMFAPQPHSTDGYPIVAARRADGEVLDVFRDPPQPVSKAKPDHIMHLFPSYRWRKFFNRIGSWSEDRKVRYFGLYAAYVCRKINRDVPDDNRFTSIHITLMKNTTLINYEEFNFEDDVGKWPCP